MRDKLLILGLLVTVTACSDDDLLPPEKPAFENLLTNGSFEQGLEGWQISSPDLTEVRAGGSPGGGEWSLELFPGWVPEVARAYQRIDGVEDGDVLRLSGEVKAAGHDRGGTIAIVVGTDIQNIRGGSAVSSTDTNWTSLVVTEPLSLEVGDMVWASVSGPTAELTLANGPLFDSLELVRVTE